MMGDERWGLSIIGLTEDEAAAVITMKEVLNARDARVLDPNLVLAWNLLGKDGAGILTTAFTRALETLQLAPDDRARMAKMLSESSDWLDRR